MLSPTELRCGPASGPSGAAGRVHFRPLQEDVPWSTARDVSPSQAAPAAPPPSHTVVVAQPNAQTGATSYPPYTPPIIALSMMHVKPPFAWRLKLPGRKRARIDLMAATWEVDVETQVGKNTLAIRILFPCAVHVAGVQLKDGGQLVGLYAYRLGRGHWKLDTAILGRQRVAHGQLVWHGVMPSPGRRGGGTAWRQAVPA